MNRITPSQIRKGRYQRWPGEVHHIITGVEKSSRISRPRARVLSIWRSGGSVSRIKED
jgi:hypothetical protein